MGRRKFFQSLAASVATLVTAYALPVQKLGRLLAPENEIQWEVVVVRGELPRHPDYQVSMLYKVWRVPA